MNKSIFLPLLLVFSILIPICGYAQGSKNKVNPDDFTQVTIEELLSDRDNYNGQRVTLEGFVDKVEYTKSSKGEPFTLFRINNGENQEVRVYYEDEHLALNKGDKVKIQGRYKKQKKYFLYKIKNVIKARTVEKLQD